MSIQRYAFDAFGPAHPGGVIIHADDGAYVTYEDHVAALRACEQRSYALGIEVGKHDGWIAGYAAGVQAASDAVASADCWYATSAAVQVAGSDVKYVVQADALAAIDNLRGEA